MEYLDARQKRTERVIEPLTVRRSGGELLLIAHCQLRNDRRTFKLDRIVQLTKVQKGAPAPSTPVMVSEEPVSEDAPSVGSALADRLLSEDASQTNNPSAHADPANVLPRDESEPGRELRAF
jgi:predicted DNA-binding transcriptional regulator YafY